MNRWTVLILFHVEVKKVSEEGTIAGRGTIQFDDNSRFQYDQREGERGDMVDYRLLSLASLAGEGCGVGKVTRVEMVDSVRKLGLKHHHY
jgi:hypothetical protein